VGIERGTMVYTKKPEPTVAEILTSEIVEMVPDYVVSIEEQFDKYFPTLAIPTIDDFQGLKRIRRKIRVAERGGCVIMDKSEIYIKMSDHPLVQDRWEPSRGDHCAAGFYCGIIIGLLKNMYTKKIERFSILREDGGTKKVYKCRMAWLPRRDDLQIMSGLGWEQFDDNCFLAANRYLISQGKDCHADEIAELVSKEQAGIMVVMQQLHDKLWDGTEWINIIK